MMMRKMFFSVTVVFLCAQLASADYANPPDWQNDPETQNFTHQSWSFSTQQTNPMDPDDGAISPGSPKFNIAPGATWVDDLGIVYDYITPIGQRQGGWRVDGPSGTPDVEMEEWFTIDIPNVQNPNLTKEVWIELTFLCSNQTLAEGIVDDVDLQIYADGIIDEAHKFAYHGSSEGPLGNSALGEIWVRSASTFSYFPQPGDETIVMRGWLEDGQYVILDQIDVDTRCPSLGNFPFTIWYCSLS